jgi:uncharacterized membrane protein HdeD (DUF308 family)
MNAMLNLATIMSDEREKLRKSWGWFVGLGCLFVAFGVVGLVFVGMLTMVAVVVVGWLFLISGVFEVIHAILRKGWSGFWLDLLSGVITAMAGLFIVMHPFGGASILTIFIGAMFLVGGIFRLATGIAMRNPYRGWFIAHGIISSILGLLILAEWPNSLLWVIGTLVAIDLLVNGLRLISFGLAVKHLPAPESDEPPRTTAAAPPA